ncbi:hypothetical protein OIU85_008543 [Salix viminalis]|uniref:Uncharacterized protein n=1 Tax=Salix viminalis TaxID=40686 RepID=A0A9Q0NXV3_SALVM|nr:hypothetical protein OIU85_008543 [Salix viminalis]
MQIDPLQNPSKQTSRRSGPHHPNILPARKNSSLDVLSWQQYGDKGRTVGQIPENKQSLSQAKVLSSSESDSSSSILTSATQSQTPQSSLLRTGGGYCVVRREGMIQIQMHLVLCFGILPDLDSFAD